MQPVFVQILWSNLCKVVTQETNESGHNGQVASMYRFYIVWHFVLGLSKAGHIEQVASSSRYPDHIRDYCKLI